MCVMLSAFVVPKSENAGARIVIVDAASKQLRHSLAAGSDDKLERVVDKAAVK